MKNFLFILACLFSFSTMEAQWEEIDLESDALLQQVCYALDNDNHIFVAGGGDIFKSIDNGDSWISLNQNYTQAIWGISFPTATIGFVCSSDGYILKTTNGGQTWDVSMQTSTGGFDRIAFKDENNGIASGSMVYVTDDGGDNWTVTQSSGFWALDHAEGDTYFGASQIRVSKTADNGNSWAPLLSDNESLFGAVDFYDATHGIVGQTGVIHICDNGFSFEEHNCPATGIVRSAVRMDYDSCYISGELGNIYKSTDAGVSWVLEESFNDTFFRNMVCTPSNTLFACGYSGSLVRKIYPDPEPNPAITIEPAALVFDSIPIGDTTFQILSVTNTGGKILEIDSLVFDNNAFWTNQEPFTLVGDESKSFEVYFTALDVGDTSGWLKIYNNTIFTGIKKVHLSGYGKRTVGLEDNNPDDEFQIFPNPTTGIVRIDIGDLSYPNINLTVHNARGKTCIQRNSLLSKSILQLDLTHLPSGLYFITVSTEKTRITQRLLIR